MTSQQEDYYNDLISIVAHDLKTPLSAAKSFIDLLQQAGPLNDQQTHFSERALLSLERMERLVADLLEYARIHSDSAFELTVCDLRTLIHEALEILEETALQRQITIYLDLDNGSALVRGDARMLSQVINNLLSNAIKYNHDGGEIWVRVAETEEGVRVDVRDTGIGIALEDQPKVFERFFRSKPKSGHSSRVEGSGLGLAIVHTIIEKHGGRIWVESVKSEGSTFSFLLPLYRYPRDSAPFYGVGDESSDVVNDDMQEPREKPDTDSKSDGV